MHQVVGSKEREREREKERERERERETERERKKEKERERETERERCSLIPCIRLDQSSSNAFLGGKPDQCCNG